MTIIESMRNRTLETTSALSGGFRRRLMIAMVVVALFTSIMFIAVLSFVWNSQFNDYTRDTLEEYASSTALALGREYDTRGYWSTSGVYGVVSTSATIEDMGVQVRNANDVVLYDNTWIGSGADGIGEISLAPAASNMVTSPIVDAKGNVVGSVNAWVYGSDVFLTTRDQSFRFSSFVAIGLSALVAVLFAILIGFVFSRMISAPIRDISAAARRLSEGDLAARSGVSGPDDVGQLGETFDAMAEVMEKDRELERRLTSDVAHELRTPLMSITATVEAMQDGVYPCDQEHLALVDSEARRLSRLVDSMLRLSRLESGSAQLNIQTTDAVSFVRGIVQSHFALLADTGLEMSFSNDTGVDELICEFDRDMVTQAVTNIVSNAMRYTPVPGSVEASVATDGENVRISVKDTGIGIAEEDIQRVFSRFWRAEESRNRVAGGLGVGMAVTKEIVDRHHGHIEVESEPGVGSTFTLVLPIHQPAE